MSLDKDDFEQIWDALASGTSPTNLRHIRYLFAGRQEAVQIINDTLTNFSRGGIPIQILIIGGERGIGKTFTALYLMSCIKENPLYQILPIYLSFDIISSPIDFISKLFYDIAFGLMQYVEEEKYRNRIRNLMENFGVSITYAKLKPEEADAPIELLTQLCEIAEDHGVKLCIILDEIDLIADKTSALKIYACFERLLGFQNNTRIPKLYVFCTTSRALEEIRKLRGLGFISRIWNALQNAPQIFLQDITEQEKKQLIEKIINVYKECYNVDIRSSFPLLLEIIKNSTKEARFPRDIITTTIEILKSYDTIKNTLKETYIQISGISMGIEIDRVFKDKLLPQINAIFPHLKYDKLENVTFPSILSPGKSRKIDGEIVFPDDFRLGIEVEYSETRATIKDEAIDQLISYLKQREKEEIKAEGAFILLGSYSQPPLTDHQQTLLKNYRMSGKIHIFTPPSGITNVRNMEQLILSARRAEGTILHDILRLALAALGMLLFLNKLTIEHKKETEELKETPVTPPKPPEKIKLRTFLSRVKIKGLGPKTLEKLEQAGFEYIDEFLKTDASQISQQLANLGYRRAPPYKIRDWQNAIQEILSSQPKIT